MKAKNHKTNLPRQQKDPGENKDLSGYPVYPASEDIYSKFTEEMDINPEDISKNKDFIDNNRAYNENDFNNEVSGNDLDVPGAELDDNQEDIGSEDEENNYYSLGGDDHKELEEDKGD